jgi:hypothetical protein
VSLPALASREPALVITACVNAAVAALAGFIPGLHPSPALVAAITTASVAVCSLAVALFARPVRRPALTAAASAVLAAMTGFGLHLDSRTIALASTAVGFAAAHVLHGKVTVAAPGETREKSASPVTAGQRLRV